MVLLLGIDWLHCAYDAHQLRQQIILKQKLVSAHKNKKNGSNLKINRSWLSELPFKLKAYKRHGNMLILNGQGDFAALIAWLGNPANLAINERIQQINLSKSPSANDLTIRLKLSNRQVRPR
ncbi:hypothetical protein [Celerinatantimonas diazotrophica]|nr:hypothetical protein [Celerinatantimonas diazotrophica]CAG9298240.1 hypothetical protein CEDIAZO_03435 [Celerinatantimonas diazotrophica]